MTSEALAGRTVECRLLDEFTGTVRSGLSAALVLVGEAGIGKTRLLDHAAASAADLQVARVAGVEPERGLAFAALHRLLRPFLERVEKLPEPQRAALAGAFGLTSGAVADLFLIGLAALTLLAGAADERPLVCLVDDAHWLDRESLAALAFVARRLHADRLGLLFTVRGDEAGPAAALAGLPTLTVTGLPAEAAHDLLARSAPGRVAPAVAERIIADTRGNPLALIELSAGLSAEQLAAGAPLPDRLPLGRRLEEHFLGRARLLPAATQSLLLLAAAAPPDDAALLWRAAGRLGLPPAVADPAVAAGVLTAAPTLAFRHPLIRSAVYSGAPAADRRRAHAAVAAAIDRDADPDRRAWHRAEATAGLDEDVAGELERVSARAGARGGNATLALFLARAAELSPDPQERARRELSAAAPDLVAGDPAAVERCHALALPGLRTPVARATAHRLGAALAWFGGGVATVTSASMLAAAAGADLPADLRDGLLFEAIAAAVLAGRHTAGTTLAELGRAARPEPGRTAAVSTVRALVDAFATRIAVGYAPAVPLLHAAVAALRVEREVSHGTVPFVMTGQWIADDLWDDEGFRAVLEHADELARRQGALHAVYAQLAGRATTAIWSGEFDRAAACFAEADDLGPAIGVPAGDTSRQIELLAWRGLEAQARAAADVALTEWDAHLGYAILGDHARHCLAILDLGRGRYAEALAKLAPGFHGDVIAHGNRALPNLVEAAVRAGDRDLARAALDRLAERATASGTPWALGMLARSRALLAADADAEALFREAAEHLTGTTIVTELVRTYLLHGEWLRRQKRRAEARAQLQIAYDSFAEMGAAAFAERARIELQATGRRARARTAVPDLDLTPQEARVAALAAEGATNAEIATRLFVTASTVEYHLMKIFRKLGITSRRQLGRALRER
ncbi:ATP-binding protein [Dactylosporangium matsuzakiense]|uniref:Transcriptional regulator n=1 Tax=Dactylosporangium matsuzakiense TaxID=53360 RepID=A0A9W6NMK8_9ACTN|nr:LuxR family transcriptional regulator [Dactylosporangium matsuzakiense]GLL02336.1 transcriptional regulator [Dactylosporangium matsuzakiense]